MEKSRDIERRRSQRRMRGERRQQIRWGVENVDRRRSAGRRREDKVTDDLKSMYELWESED